MINAPEGLNQEGQSPTAISAIGNIFTHAHLHDANAHMWIATIWKRKPHEK